MANIPSDLEKKILQSREEWIKRDISRQRTYKIGIVVALTSLATAVVIGVGAAIGYTLSQQKQTFTLPPANQPYIEQSYDETNTLQNNTSQDIFTQDAPGPFREQYITSIGSGALSNVYYYDGMHPFAESDLWSNQYFDIQRIRREEQPSGCDTAKMDSDFIWFGSGSPTDLLVNGLSIGHLDSATGRHGYLMEYPVKAGDTLCVSEISPNGFHIIIGETKDLFAHYDSYCSRGNC